ncbi:MAG: glycoside hydrolase family 95 protein [Armatimonadetes bacterium]|nr:glycoside hydrolase family 95 protein [Armatimonadota bacterium]
MNRRDILKAFAATAFTPLVGSIDVVNGTPDELTEGIASNLKLWYDRPANNWLEALPLGNGRIGAMVYGGLATETVQLNELTLWAGQPHCYNNPEAKAFLEPIREAILAGDYKLAQDLVGKHWIGRPWAQMPYQPFGSLKLAFDHSATEPTHYRRELDLDSAITTTTYQLKGTKFRREAFISYPDQVFIMRITADNLGQIGFTAEFETPHVKKQTSANGNDLILEVEGGAAKGLDGGVRGYGILRVIADGVQIQSNDSQLTVKGANAVTLLVSLATSYHNYRDITDDPIEKANRWLAQAKSRTFGNLKSSHEADYRSLFDRVHLDFGAKPSQLPTDQRILAFPKGQDPELVALHFQYARYLLISSSRPGGQPATLQGIWNNSLEPAWDSKYTVNINAEMNYWPAESCALSECHEPLFQLISEIAETGAKTAQDSYGARGWVCHHNTDVWRGTAPVDWYGSGMWPLGGAWLCMHLWEHYLYGLDKQALAKHYPLMKGAAQFFLDTLIEEPKHKWLVTCPSLSPEHEHHERATLCAGPTMDMQILRDLFGACAKASEILETDADFRREVQDAQARLAPMQVGAQGQLQEWAEDWDADAPDQKHRHVSHLYGLYPSHQITPSTPDLFAAAKRTLEIRGDEGVGWSLAWKIAFWARLLDGNHAFKLVSEALKPADATSTRYDEGGGVYPNLFDSHPPFQIDGNFGFAAGIVEMLMQSHLGEIHLLPARPDAWPNGSVRGLRARGGYVVDVEWKKGQLSRALIRASHSGKCVVRYGDKRKEMQVKTGGSYRVEAHDFL